MAEAHSTPEACASYHVGHHVHYIQARLWGERAETRVPVLDLDVAPDGLLTLTLETGEAVRWHHDPAAAARAWATRRGEPTLGSPSILAVPDTNGRTRLLSVCDLENRQPCVGAPPPGTDTVAEVDRAGGFLGRPAE